MSVLWSGCKIGFFKNKQKSYRSAAREWALQHDGRKEEATKHIAEKKDEHIGRFKLFLHREINTVHEFFVRAIFEGLPLIFLPWISKYNQINWWIRPLRHFREISFLILSE